MKRFYKNAGVLPMGDLWGIGLDGKPVKTPAGHPLCAPTEALAVLAVEEWAAQEDKIDPETMPVTQFLTTAIDHVDFNRDEIEGYVLAYLNTDLILYRTIEPPVLAKRQADAWDPWVEWFNKKSGATLKTTTDLRALVQEDAAHEYARAKVRECDLWRFNALQMATLMSGSIILALAFMAGDADEDTVFKAAQIEELYRSELYNEALHGLDPQQEKKQKSLRRDLAMLHHVLRSFQK